MNTDNLEKYLVDACDFYDSLNGCALIHRLTSFPGSARAFQTFLTKYVTPSTINLRNNDGDTALMLAVRGQHVEKVRALIKAGADVGVCNNSRETPLSYACTTLRQPSVLDELLRSPTAVSAFAVTDSDGNTVLTAAVNNLYIHIVKKLLDAKASPNQVTIDIESPLDVLISTTHYSDAHLLKTRILQLLLDAGASVGGRDKDGHHRLTKAVTNASGRYINAEFVRKLVAAGANPWVPESDNITPFEAACTAKVEDSILVAMLDAAPIAAASVVDRCVDLLNTAIRDGREDLAAAMLRAGADVLREGCTEDSDSDYDHEDENEEYDVNTPLWHICMSTDLQMAERLVKCMKCNMLEIGGTYSLYLVEKGNVGMLRILKNAGAGLGWFNSPSCITTLMNACTQPAALELVEVLIDADEVNDRDNTGRTALFYAVESDKPDLVRLLLDNGADDAVADNDGKTVLMLDACKEVTDVLVKYAERRIIENAAAAAIVAAKVEADATSTADAADKSAAAKKKAAAKAKAARRKAAAKARAAVKAAEDARTSTESPGY